MSSLSRLVQVGYVVGLALILSLLLWPSSSRAQNGFGISTGYRATPALPVIAIPYFPVSGSGVGGGVGGGASGFGGGSGGGGATISFSNQPSIFTFDLGNLFPNHGQFIGLPPPTLMPPLNNSLSDTTGSPLGLIIAIGAGGGAGAGSVIGGNGGGLGGGAGGIGGGAGGLAGGGGMGGFAGKGMGGFNGKKPL